MKKLFSLCLILCLAFSLCASITVIAYADETEAPTVYVYDEQGWDMNVYCYTSSGDFGSGWPGMSLDSAPEIGEDWYSFVFPQSIKGVTGLHIIVFDKNDEQVNRFDSVYSVGKNYYNTYNASGFDTAQKAMDDAKAKRPKLVDTIYVYNYSIDSKAERWNNISAACFDNATNEQLSDVVTLTKATTLGAYWYKYDLPQTAKDKAAEDYKFRAKVLVYDGHDNRNQLAIVAPVASKAYYNTYRTYG
ncbi:MAG: hypothetical protein K2M64_01855, partial [Clostridia bacterium]|nr:hypothetical protein [Clostridia bacterium]